MQNTSSTRECTKVYLSYPGDLEEITFTKREYYLEDKFSWKPFKSDRKMNVDSIQELLEGKERELLKKKEEGVKILKKKCQHKPLTWEEKMNERRKRVETCILNQDQKNLAEVCRFTGCSFSMVKRVDDDLAFKGEASTYFYPNLKQPLELNKLSTSISNVNGSFATIADLKRRNPGFSRKYIARKLKATGHRWLMVRKNMRKPIQPTHSDQEVLTTVRHLAQSLINEQVETYYIDEVHFPLYQTSDHHWTHPHYEGHDLYYNRRQTCGEKLSVIAMCSTERFVAIQVFQREVCGDDFVYFLQEALKRVPKSSTISVLLDNATWHTSKTVLRSKASKALEFNARGLFQANMIENAFSFVRAAFRKRPDACSFEEEARLLLQIFFDDRNIKRFEGITRNHVRSLQSLLYKHYTAIASRMQRTKRATKKHI